MALRQLTAYLHEFEGGDGEALVLKALEDSADEAALDAIGFQDDERSFHAGFFQFVFS